MSKITAFCFLQIERTKRKSVQEILIKIPQVKAFYRLTGDYNGLIELEADDTDGLYALYSQHIDNLEGIIETYTQVVIKKFSK